MYVIKIEDGLGMYLSGKAEIVNTLTVVLYWEHDDGKLEKAATGASCEYKKSWPAKKIKHYRDWLWDKGCDLKAERQAYLKKNGERLEVKNQRERDAKDAERKRIRGIRERCANSWRDVLNALQGTELARRIEFGE